MFQSFKSFVEDKQSVWSEGQGYTPHKEVEFPTKPFANLLSLIPGDAQRNEALVWLTTDGLLEASLNREELCKLVNIELEKSHNNQPIPFNNVRGVKNIPPTRKIEMALDPWVSSGNHYNPENSIFQPVSSLDLFNPKAWEQRPELNDVRIHGENILDYYDKHFEPKMMHLSSDVFNLDELRQALISVGLPPFKYGGFKGYIQYTESGKSLAPDERYRVLRPAGGQHGPDLRPAQTINNKKEKLFKMDCHE